MLLFLWFFFSFILLILRLGGQRCVFSVGNRVNMGAKGLGVEKNSLWGQNDVV